MNSVNPLHLRRALAAGEASPTLTLQFLGLLVFTVIVVTTRWPGADFAIAFALGGMLIGHQKVRFPAPFWWGIALVGWAYATSVVAMSPAQATTTAYDRLKVMLIFLVVMNALRTDRQLRIYLMVLVGSFMIYPARGAILNYVHGDTLFGRTIWNNIYANPNDLAAFSLLAMGAALSLYARGEGARAVRIGAGVCAGVLLLVVLLTQSRGAFIGLLVGFGPPTLKRLFKKPQIPIYAAIMTAIFITILPDSLWVRLSGLSKLTSTATIAQADPEGSAEQRWQVQKTGWRIFTDHPLLGVGAGCYPLANDRYSTNLGERDTHDTYLNLAAELGLPGLFMWLGLVSSVLLNVRRHRTLRGDMRPPPAPTSWLQCGFIAYLTAGIFGTYWGVSMGYLILGALWAAPMVLAGTVHRQPAHGPRSKGI